MITTWLLLKTLSLLHCKFWEKLLLDYFHYIIFSLLQNAITTYYCHYYLLLTPPTWRCSTSFPGVWRLTFKAWCEQAVSRLTWLMDKEYLMTGERGCLLEDWGLACLILCLSRYYKTGGQGDLAAAASEVGQSLDSSHCINKCMATWMLGGQTPLDVCSYNFHLNIQDGQAPNQWHRSIIQRNKMVLIFKLLRSGQFTAWRHLQQPLQNEIAKNVHNSDDQFLA
jgi:hypothetical protein